MPAGVYTRKPVAERFAVKTRSGEPPAHRPDLGPCLIWTASFGSSGYGQVRHNGRVKGAHVVAWELENGPVPDGAHVLHRCDIQACVRGAHLFLGTQQSNMRDMWDKRRGATGERHGQHRLTVATARAAKQMRADGLSQKRIARILGVSPGCIQRLCDGNTWKGVDKQP